MNHVSWTQKHGFEVLQAKKNKIYSREEKERIINRFLLNNESTFSIAIDEGLSNDGLLFTWISKYKKTIIIQLNESEDVQL